MSNGGQLGGVLFTGIAPIEVIEEWSYSHIEASRQLSAWWRESLKEARAVQAETDAARDGEKAAD